MRGSFHTCSLVPRVSSVGGVCACPCSNIFSLSLRVSKFLFIWKREGPPRRREQLLALRHVRLGVARGVLPLVPPVGLLSRSRRGVHLGLQESAMLPRSATTRGQEDDNDDVDDVGFSDQVLPGLLRGETDGRLATQSVHSPGTFFSLIHTCVLE